MLASSIPSASEILDAKRLLIDSDVLMNWTKDPEVRLVMHAAQTAYSLAFSTVSLLEVGFGPIEKIEEAEQKMARAIYHQEGIARCTAQQFSAYEARHSIPAGAVFSINPGHEEWLMARNVLIDAMSDSGTRSRRIDELRNDALFFATAHNTRCALITNNAKDYRKLNRCFAKSIHASMVPVFSVADLWRSLQGELVSFPENMG